jgi:hypothetical protein
MSAAQLEARRKAGLIPPKSTLMVENLVDARKTFLTSYLR